MGIYRLILSDKTGSFSLKISYGKFSFKYASGFITCTLKTFYIEI
jgi:hypothetical protein